MIRQAFLILLLFPSLAFSESFLCIPEAGASVGDLNGKFNSRIQELSSQMFVHENKAGKWSVKMLGAVSAIFDECYDGGVFCRGSKGFTGSFSRDKTNEFHVVWLGFSKDGWNLLLSAKGKCSKI